MCLRDGIASVLHVLVLISYSLLSIFLALLSIRPDWRMSLIQSLQETPEIYCWASGGVAGFVLFLLLWFFWLGKKRFLLVSMKPNSTLVDRRLLEAAVEKCLRDHFSRDVEGISVTIRLGGKLEMVIDCPSVADKARCELLLKDMESNLCVLVRERFGYDRPFTLCVRH